MAVLSFRLILVRSDPRILDIGTPAATWSQFLISEGSGTGQSPCLLDPIASFFLCFPKILSNSPEERAVRQDVLKQW